MATMQLTIGALAATWTISQPDIQRILDSIKRDHGKVPGANPGDPPRDMTNQECFNIVASRLTTWLNEMNVSSEKAATPIPPIVMTPG